MLASTNTSCMCVIFVCKCITAIRFSGFSFTCRSNYLLHILVNSVVYIFTLLCILFTVRLCFPASCRTGNRSRRPAPLFLLPPVLYLFGEVPLWNRKDSPSLSLLWSQYHSKLKKVGSFSVISS